LRSDFFGKGSLAPLRGVRIFGLVSRDLGMKIHARFAIIAVFLSLAAWSAAAQVLVAPRQVLIAPLIVMNNRETVKASVSRLDVSGRYSMAQFLKIGVDDGLLTAELLPDLPVQNNQTRVEIEGSTAIWAVRRRVLAGPNSLYTTLMRYDFDAPPDQFWSTVLSMRPGYLGILATQGDNNQGLRVQLTQSNGRLTFTCDEIQQGSIKRILMAPAASLRDLQTEHPREVRQYLAPLLRSLSGRMILRPGATDIYQIFTTVTPDRAVVKKLDRLLSGLDSDDYAQRERASRELAALGAPGVLAALRRDNDDLSAEARSRLDKFIADHSTMTLERAKALRDMDFLLDCMEDDEDAGVRRAAQSALGKLIGSPVHFDPDVNDKERAAAVDALRAKLVRPATTKPAQQNASPGVIR
jgi:hypothetical protein